MKQYKYRLQYYYQQHNCPVRYAHHPDCICWHDEGSGPYPEAELPRGINYDPDVPANWRLVKEEVT